MVWELGYVKFLESANLEAAKEAAKRAGRPKGAKRATAEGQLSARGRHMLAVLLLTERAMLEGTAAQQRTARNKGVPWDAAAMVEALGSDTASSTLANLEGRRLVCCWAEGSGRGRRVSHVKLSAQAVDVAEYWIKHRQSKEQHRRRMTKLYTELHQLPDGTEYAVYGAISRRMADEDAARVARYSLGNNYQLAAFKAVPDDVF